MVSLSMVTHYYHCQYVTLLELSKFGWGPSGPLLGSGWTPTKNWYYSIKIISNVKEKPLYWYILLFQIFSHPSISIFATKTLKMLQNLFGVQADPTGVQLDPKWYFLYLCVCVPAFNTFYRNLELKILHSSHPI